VYHGNSIRELSSACPILGTMNVSMKMPTHTLTDSTIKG
jgi:hypothetical protein